MVQIILCIPSWNNRLACWIGTTLLGRLQEKSLEHNDCLYAESILKQRVRKPNRQCLYSAKLLSNKLLKCYPNTFKKNWNNTRSICLNVNLHIWDIFLHTGLTENHIFFTIRSTAFFSSTVFVIFMLTFFLIRRQSSEDILWRSYFRWTPRKTSVKEHIFITVASLQLCWKCTVL